MKRRALLSVSDKTGIQGLAEGLVQMGWEILSTGGTSKILRSASIAVTDVSEITKHDEIMEGRVKTLHPAVLAGILARRESDEDLDTLADYGYGTIDLVAVNLYPFGETIKSSSVTMSKAMSQVDVGGPTMLRSGAKNHKHVWTLVDPDDYPLVLSAIEETDVETEKVRKNLARKVFQHLSIYDNCIANFLSEEAERKVEYPAKLTLVGDLVEELRYGENPTQTAAFYSMGNAKDGLASLKQMQGKSLSYNNLLDLDGALLSLSPFSHCPDPVVCIVKHTTPCGIAKDDTVLGAFEAARGCDPQSAFGSVIAVNQEINASAAEAMADLFVECIIAPNYTSDALVIFEKKKNLRLMSSTQSSLDTDISRSSQFLADYGQRPEPMIFRSVYGGLLVQDPAPVPFYGDANNDWEVVSAAPPTQEELDDLSFAWSCVFGIKSNAIVLVQSGATIGIGAGQMSRVDSSRLAVLKASDVGATLEGSVLASDAFFPFRDGVDAAVEAGIRSIIQPGGSMRDEEVIRAADEHGISMVFTGNRLFRH